MSRLIGACWVFQVKTCVASTFNFLVQPGASGIVVTMAILSSVYAKLLLSFPAILKRT